MTTTSQSPAKFSETFNRAAEALGCRARIEVSVKNSARYGRKNSAKFFEMRGYTTAARELIYPIDASRFDMMLDRYPSLRALSRA